MLAHPTSYALVANIAAVMALVAMMLGVGLGIGEELPRLYRALDRKRASFDVLANVVLVPAATAFVLSVFGVEDELAVAILLLACLPAGPISLLFVGQSEERIARSTALVLLLQLVSVVVSPLLLLGLGEVVTGSPIVATPRTAAVSMGAQILVLETLPIVIGALVAQRQPAAVGKLRGALRLVTIVLLLTSGTAFSTLYVDRLQHGVPLAVTLSFMLLGLCWALPRLFSRGAAWHDAAQVTGLRNISLSIVVAGTTPGLEGSVIFVLIGALVLSVAAPVLRAFAAKDEGFSVADAAESVR